MTNMKRKAIISQKINQLFDFENYEEARKLLKQELKVNTDEHWLLVRIATTYYEEKKYKQALEFSEQAIQIAPNCPLTLWEYAGDLEMTGDIYKAIGIWKKLLNKDTQKLANGPCGEGLTAAKALQMDCAFRLGIAFRDLNKVEESKKYFDLHLKLRYPGNRSIYKRTYVMNRIKKQPLTNGAMKSTATGLFKFK